MFTRNEITNLTLGGVVILLILYFGYSEIAAKRETLRRLEVNLRNQTSASIAQNETLMPQAKYNSMMKEGKRLIEVRSILDRYFPKRGSDVPPISMGNILELVPKDVIIDRSEKTKEVLVDYRGEEEDQSDNNASKQRGRVQRSDVNQTAGDVLFKFTRTTFAFGLKAYYQDWLTFMDRLNGLGRHFLITDLSITTVRLTDEEKKGLAAGAELPLEIAFELETISLQDA